MSTEIVTVFNRIPDRAREPYYNPAAFLASLARFGVTPTVLGLNEPWGGLMTKPRRLRQWLRAGGCKAETLIVCDAFDVVFTVPPDEVGETYRDLWPQLPLVFNAEKDLFPRGELARRLNLLYEDSVRGADPKIPDSPWRYLNSGFAIGPPAKMLALLESMWLDDVHDDVTATDDLHGGTGTHINPNDQGHFQYAHAAQVVPIVLDYRCVLCQTFSGCEMAEFELSDGHVLNLLTGTRPLVAHFNGGSKNSLMPVFLDRWGLA